MPALTGSRFWQEESYDHLVRHLPEFKRIRHYIEGNPVRAGLVVEASDYRWSSAGRATVGSPADLGGPPHKPEPVSTGYAQVRLTDVRLDSSPFLCRTPDY